LTSRFAGDGFLCVDLHLPTDIDILYEMKAAGANVYLHILHPNPQPGDLKARMPEYLLHTKVVLFDLPQDAAELWVGSHNWTARALSGLNIEASTVFRLSREAPLFSSAVQLLDQIRSRCEPFDLSSRAYYKWLQGQSSDEDPTWVLEVQGELSPTLAGTRITVFESSEDQYRNLRSVDRDLIVAALDPRSDTEHLYHATITDTGRLTDAGMTFGSRIHGVHDGRERPKLSGPCAPAGAALTATHAWATVQIKDQLSPSMALFELPPKDRWVTVEVDSFENRVAQQDRGLFLKPSRPLVSRPVSKAVFEGKAEPETTSALMIRKHDLVRRMIIRSKE
jgi:hypothetical protein